MEGDRECGQRSGKGHGNGVVHTGFAAGGDEKTQKKGREQTVKQRGRKGKIQKPGETNR